MKAKGLWTGLILAALSVSGVCAETEKAPRILKTGNYSATVTAIPCSACPPVIEKTLNAQPGIGEVAIDQKASTVNFTVKPGAEVVLTGLQQSLKAASDQMGMGADYSLKNVQQTDATPAAKSQESHEGMQGMEGMH